jgi:peptidoglycan-N-acetylglucosamine deacetylase
MHKQVIVTTSWDDGDPLDLRLAEMLFLRGLPGTFYVPIIGYLGRNTLKAADLREMAGQGFEIGAHSYSHRSLRGLQDFELKHEIRRCRCLLEDATARPVTMFCYPNGHYDAATLNAVREYGYVGARTTRMLRTDAGDNQFEVPITLQVFPHPQISYVKNAIKGGNVSSLLLHSARLLSVKDWVELGTRTFDHVLRYGGVWHLYGHSWEIEDHRLWCGLSTLLDYVSHRDGVLYMNNSEMVQAQYPQPVATTVVA